MPSTFSSSLATRFNGSTQGAYVDNPSFKNDTTGSFSMWIRQYSPLTSAGARTILSLGESGGSYFWMMGQRWSSSGTLATPNQPIFETYTSVPAPNNQASYPPTYIIPATTRLHVVCQSAGLGNFQDWYINGVLYTAGFWFDQSGTQAAKGAWMNWATVHGANRFSVAYRTAGAPNYNDLQMDELSYVNRVRTPAEVAAEYNAGAGRNPLAIGYGSALKNWWRMGEGDIAGTIYDRIGADHLTTIAAPTYEAP